jgi:rod shape determining protein RodA
MGRRIFATNFALILALLGLIVFGLFAQSTIELTVVRDQALFAIVSAILIYVIAMVDQTVLVWFAPIGYVLSNVFLALTYAWPSIRGAHRWIFVGPIQVQPSEITKPFFLLFFAWLIAKYPPRNVKNLLIQGSLFVPPILLIVRQPDLGTTIVYCIAWLVMLIGGGLSLKLVLGVGVAGFSLLPFIWNLLHDFQRDRIITFINPGHDPMGVGYNAIQAMIAVGSGQLFGRGLGRGTQSHMRFLPEFHTDFIFATVIEELGFVGGTLLLFLYGFLLWRLLSPLIRGKITHILTFTYTLGVFGLILTQMFVNIGMNMGIAPITGITLPFISAGGSSLISLGITFGILFSFWQSRTKLD